jgi:transposase
MRSYAGVVRQEVDDMAYSMEYRRAVAAMYEECGSSAEVAEQMGCSESWVRRLMQRQRESGSLEPRQRKMPDNRKLKAADLAELERLIAGQSDLTLAELAAKLGNKVSVPTVHRACVKLKLPLKKSRSAPPSRTAGT